MTLFSERGLHQCQNCDVCVLFNIFWTRSESWRVYDSHNKIVSRRGLVAREKIRVFVSFEKRMFILLFFSVMSAADRIRF